MLGFGRLLGLRWRRGKAEAEVVVIVTIGRCAIVKRREFWEAASECLFSVEVCEVELKRETETFKASKKNPFRVCRKESWLWTLLFTKEARSNVDKTKRTL